MATRGLYGLTEKLNDSARAVLDGPHIAVIATANADGRPQSSVIFVKRDGDTVVFSTIKGQAQDAQHDARPAGQPVDAGQGERPVCRTRGTVQITEDPEKRLLYEMYGRYMGGAAPPPEPDAERLIVRITAEKVYQFRRYRGLQERVHS